jgi:cation transport ATPase
MHVRQTQHSTTQRNTAQHNTAQHNTTQHNTTQHNTTQHDTTQHNTTQHNTTQHNTTQHNTAQRNTTQQSQVQTLRFCLAMAATSSCALLRASSMRRVSSMMLSIGTAAGLRAITPTLPTPGPRTDRLRIVYCADMTVMCLLCVCVSLVMSMYLLLLTLTKSGERAAIAPNWKINEQN